jgi:prolipoprotein diacylglyceryltransferase
MYGGLLLALPLSLPVTAMLGLPFAAFWDTVSFTLLVGMVVARAGCLLRGCCSGRPADGWFALELADDRGVRARRIPAQLLEAGWALAVLAGAVVVWMHRPFAGAVILCTIGGYAGGRIALESTREAHGRVVGARVQRIISTAFVAGSVVVFAMAWVR